MNPCKYKKSCRVRQAHKERCSDLSGENPKECPIYLEYNLTGFGREEYDVRLKKVQERIDREKAESHLVAMTNRAKGRPFGKGWRAG